MIRNPEFTRVMGAEYRNKFVEIFSPALSESPH